MSYPAFEVSQVTHVCTGLGPAGLTEFAFCWKAQEGSTADERGEASWALLAGEGAIYGVL